MTPAFGITLVLIPVVLWRMYQRIKRLVGRQQSKLSRHWTAAVLFPLLVLMLGAAVFRNSAALISLCAGSIIGVAGGLWGLHLTRFEHTPQGFFYTPNAHIGIALSLLFVGRILYRLVQIVATAGTAQPPAQSFAQSPFTVLTLGMLAAYYASYAIGMLRWRLTQRSSSPAAAG